MQELERQIVENDRRIKEEQLNAGLDEHYVDLDQEILETNTNANAKMRQTDDIENKTQETIEIARNTIENIEGDPGLLSQVQEYDADLEQIN